MNILMVCLGNICRSPIAEGVMKQKMIDNHLKGIIDSAGVISYHSGEAPDKRAIAISRKNNIDISDQRARQFSKTDFNSFDLILTMDQSVHAEILKEANSDSDRNKVQLFLNYSNSKTSKDVPDPYYGGAEGFENVFRMIDLCCESIAVHIKNLNT